jgi:putative ABC transport system permease protein
MLLLNAVRERIRGIDKDQPLGRPIPLEEVLGRETVQPRFNMALFSFFGFLGLALAAVGIYSMLSYTVARRTHEIGIRTALGVACGDVLHLMLAMATRLVLLGLGLGLAGSLALAKVLRAEVFQVPGTDPVALEGVVLLLTLTAFLACFCRPAGPRGSIRCWRCDMNNGISGLYSWKPCLSRSPCTAFIQAC